jgi:hypothetical protein
MDKTSTVQTVQMLCVVWLLLNLLGGIISTALHAYEKPGPELPLTQRLSFRAFAAGQLIFTALAVYYHYSFKAPTVVEWVFWGTSFLMAPLVAKFGSLVASVAYSKKLAARKKAYAKWLDANTSEEDKISQAIEKQSKVTDDKEHDDFAFMKNYTKDELK